MKFLLTIFFLISCTTFTATQSGRIKDAQPQPTPKESPLPEYLPTKERPRIMPSPPIVDLNDEGGVVRIESTLVPIPVSVLDERGRTVTNLKLSDFELKINGKTVQISEMMRSETPVRLAMLFDNSTSVTDAREFETAAAVKFLRRVLRPEKDLAALYRVSTVTRLEQGFTNEISALVRSIETFPPPAGATALLDGMILASEYLAEVSGRRVVVIVSDGEDTASDSTLEQTLRSLQLANSQVYIVKTTDLENYKRTGKRGGNANIRQLVAERRMSEIASQTGGRVYSPIDEKELEDAFRQISSELSEQYILSYYPDEKGSRGEFREISLAIAAKQNLTLRTRKGYYVPK